MPKFTPGALTLQELSFATVDSILTAQSLLDMEMKRLRVSKHSYTDFVAFCFNIKELENLPCEEKMKELDVLSVEKGKVREELSTLVQYYKVVTMRTEVFSSQGAVWRRQVAMDTSCTGKCFISM